MSKATKDGKKLSKNPALEEWRSEAPDMKHKW
jgi:hypothetical protein